MKKMILTVFAAVAVAGSAGAQSGVRYPYVTDENGGFIVVLRDSKGGIDESSLFTNRVTETPTGDEKSSNNRMSRKFRIQKGPGIESYRKDVIAICDTLTEDGYTDWRVPTQREIMMIWIVGGGVTVHNGERIGTPTSGQEHKMLERYLIELDGFTPINNYLTSGTQIQEHSDERASWLCGFINLTHNCGHVTGKYIEDNGYLVRCVRDEW